MSIEEIGVIQLSTNCDLQPVCVLKTNNGIIACFFYEADMPEFDPYVWDTNVFLANWLTVPLIRIKCLS